MLPNKEGIDNIFRVVGRVPHLNDNLPDRSGATAPIESSIPTFNPVDFVSPTI